VGRAGLLAGHHEAAQYRGRLAAAVAAEKQPVLPAARYPAEEQRTREIGLQMALGATGAGIGRMVITRGLVEVALGLAIGLAGALAVTRVLRALLVQVSPTDPATFVAMSAFEVGVALLACWLPASRAARVDPIRALRHD
jgi:ABC-type antimicrobial peptide transport system permease subunit